MAVQNSQLDRFHVKQALEQAAADIRDGKLLKSMALEQQTAALRDALAVPLLKAKDLLLVPAEGRGGPHGGGDDDDDAECAALPAGGWEATLCTCCIEAMQTASCVQHVYFMLMCQFC